MTAPADFLEARDRHVAALRTIREKYEPLLEAASRFVDALERLEETGDGKDCDAFWWEIDNIRDVVLSIKKARS